MRLPPKTDQPAQAQNSGSNSWVGAHFYALFCTLYVHLLQDAYSSLPISYHTLETTLSHARVRRTAQKEISPSFLGKAWL